MTRPENNRQSADSPERTNTLTIDEVREITSDATRQFGPSHDQPSALHALISVGLADKTTARYRLFEANQIASESDADLMGAVVQMARPK